MKNIMKVIGFLTRREVVALKDFDNDVVYRVVRKDAWGTMTAERMGGFAGKGISKVTLNPDGTVSGNLFTEHWKYV